MHLVLDIKCRCDGYECVRNLGEVEERICKIPLPHIDLDLDSFKFRNFGVA